jgi:hypothetical protein
MKSQIKTYNQFINEAYIDDSGELRDFDQPQGDEPEFQLLDHAQRIQEYLEESGANRVRLRVRGGVMEFTFNYNDSKYLLELNIDENQADLSLGEILVYEDSVDSFFDLLAANGLEFLNY